MYLPYDTEFHSLICIKSNENNFHEETCTIMFTATLCIVAPHSKQPWKSSGGQLVKWWSHSLEQYWSMMGWTTTTHDKDIARKYFPEWKKPYTKEVQYMVPFTWNSAEGKINLCWKKSEQQMPLRSCRWRMNRKWPEDTSWVMVVLFTIHACFLSKHKICNLILGHSLHIILSHFFIAVKYI